LRVQNVEKFCLGFERGGLLDQGELDEESLQKDLRPTLESHEIHGKLVKLISREFFDFGNYIRLQFKKQLGMRN
jgi:hypothetical protein